MISPGSHPTPITISTGSFSTGNPTAGNHPGSISWTTGDREGVSTYLATDDGYFITTDDGYLILLGTTTGDYTIEDGDTPTSATWTPASL